MHRVNSLLVSTLRDKGVGDASLFLTACLSVGTETDHLVVGLNGKSTD